MRILTLILIFALTAPVFAQTSNEADTLDEHFIELVESVSPSVVLVKHRPERQNASGFRSSAQFGAGILIEGGYVLTALTNVPENAQNPGIELRSGVDLEVRVVVRDTLNAIALLEVTEETDETLPALELATERPVVGDVVFALGNEFDSLLDDSAVSVSRGVVSNIYRNREHSPYRGTLIETDAAVNPGTYGGPLIDINGTVVGVCISAYSQSNFLGTAVPACQIAAVLDTLTEGEITKAGNPGVRIYETKTGVGVGLTEVFEGGSADSAGLLADDVVLSVDGEQILSPLHYHGIMDLVPPGSTVTFRVKRGDREFFVAVTLAIG